MQEAQKKDIQFIEETQRRQFLEFSQAWDKYMTDYEAAAYTTLEKLKARHDHEAAQLKATITKQSPVKYNLSKELMSLKMMEKKYFSLKNFEQAQSSKRQALRMEKQEREDIESQFQEKLDREDEKLRSKQQAALSSLLKRMQRDRDEQLKHRQQDSQRLVQRNRNLLADQVKKQQTEQKRTTEFLKYSLGKRSSPQKTIKILDYESSAPKLPQIRNVSNDCQKGLFGVHEEIIGGSSKKLKSNSNRSYSIGNRIRQQNNHNKDLLLIYNQDNSSLTSFDKMNSKDNNNSIQNARTKPSNEYNGYFMVQKETQQLKEQGSHSRASSLSINKSTVKKGSPSSSRSYFVNSSGVKKHGHNQESSTDIIKDRINRVKKMKFNMERYGGISIKYKGYNGDSNSVKEGKQDPNSSDSSRKTPLEPLRQDSDVNQFTQNESQENHETFEEYVNGPNSKFMGQF